MSRIQTFLALSAFFLLLAGCGGGNNDANFQGAPPVSQDEADAAKDYEKQMQEDFKKNYGTN